MSEIKKILEEQLEREKASAKKDLNMSNLQAMYMITSTLCNMKSLECESVPGKNGKRFKGKSRSLRKCKNMGTEYYIY